MVGVKFEDLNFGEFDLCEQPNDAKYFTGKTASAK